MKALKKSLAIILCITTLFSLLSLSASALKVGDKVIWFEEDDPESSYELIYKGSVKEGSNPISDPEEYLLCYEFEPEKDGYYRLTSHHHFFFVDTYTDSIAKNYKYNIYCGYSDEYGWDINSRIYYLEKGNTYLLYTECDSESKNLEIEYFADEITDVKYNETELNSIITDLEDFYYDESGKTGEIYEYIEITFSKSGVETTIERHWIDFTYENELVSGENNVTLVLPGYEEEITIGLYESSDYIESIECSNSEEYLEAVEYYNCAFDYADLNGLNITVNFKDGTKESIVYNHSDKNYIEFPNGKTYYIDAGATCDERTDVGSGKLTLYVSIAHKWFYLYEYDVKEATVFENYNLLTNTVSDNISNLFEDIGRYIGYMFEDGRYNFWIDIIVSDIKFVFSYGIIKEISLFFQNAF